MDQIITYDKSYQQRLQEYLDVLSGYEVLAASQVKKEWGFYLELVIDPNGWQGVWKIPRMVCEKLKILYPTIVLVYVDNVNFKDLTAFVKILAVQDDIHLPENHIVPLIQLWPTKQQDDTVGLNLPATSNAVDMLHFFYTHLWMPWDNDDEDNVDWISKHLETRLRLYYDIKMGIIPRNTAEHLRSLLTEAKTLQMKRECLEEELSDSEDIDIDINTTDDKNVLNESIQSLMKFHIRMTQIRSEVEILENPVLRAVLLRHKTESFDSDEEKAEVPKYWLIFKSGEMTNGYFDYLEKVKNHVNSDTKFNTATTLQTALNNANPNDTLLICTGKHIIRSAGSLEEGGFFKGLDLDETQTEIASDSENIMLDFSGENTIFENITINAGVAQCGILVRKGKLTLQNCRLIGHGRSTIHQGIIVLPESELHLENCTISGFATAIVGNAASKLSVLNSRINDVEIGAKLYDKTIANIQNCTFSTCKQYGISVESDEENIKDEQITGDIKILEKYKDMTITDCKFQNCTKSEVTIGRKQRIVPIRDLFSNPKFDMTLNSSVYDHHDKQDMEM